MPNYTVGNTRGQRLGNADYVKYGYGQVEPNHLSEQRTGQIWAQLPAKADIELLENGQFAKYDYANGVVDFDGEGEWLMVFNEIKVYNDRDTDADFAMKKDNYVARVYSSNGTMMPADTTMVPRLIKVNVGDIWTTNTVKETELAVGDKLTPGADGYLAKAGADAADYVIKVVKVYTMPDGQPGVKLQRIK